MLTNMFERPMPMYDAEPTGGPVGGWAEAGAEDPGFAEPGTDTGGREPELAEPGEQTEEGERPAQTPEENAAFAAMRRENERLQREREERDQILAEMFPGSPDPVAEAMMQLYGVTPELLEAERIGREVQARQEAELLQLRELVAQSTFEKDLSAIKEAYPEIKAKTVDELGPAFLQIMSAGGLDAVTAYEIARAKEERTKRTPPPEIGKVNTGTTPEKGYYTAEEVKAMTQDEVSRHWDKIQKSRARWR